MPPINTNAGASPVKQKMGRHAATAILAFALSLVFMFLTISTKPTSSTDALNGTRNRSTGNVLRNLRQRYFTQTDPLYLTLKSMIVDEDGDHEEEDDNVFSMVGKDHEILKAAGIRVEENLELITPSPDQLEAAIQDPGPISTQATDDDLQQLLDEWEVEEEESGVSNRTSPFGAYGQFGDVYDEEYANMEIYAEEGNINQEADGTRKNLRARRRAMEEPLFVANTGPGKCNAGVELASCTSITQFMLSSTAYSGNVLIIPCGQCVTVDITDGRTVNFPGEINVIGKLFFPNTAHVTIEARGIIVQGIFEVEPPLPGSVIPDNDRQVKISLYGEEDVTFFPDGDNRVACGGSECNLDKKAFVIAGGRMNVVAMEDSCPTHTKLVSVKKTSETRSMTSDHEVTCDQGQIIGGTDSLLFTDRYTFSGTATHRYLIPEERACIVPNKMYILSGKFRLVRQNPSIPSQCSANGKDCPHVFLSYKAATDEATTREVGWIPREYKHVMTDDSWIEFSFYVTFGEEEVAGENEYVALSIDLQTDSVSAAILEVDALQLKLPSRQSQSGEAKGCDDLVPADGTAEALGNGFDSYPFQLYGVWGAAFMHVTEDPFDESNHIFAVRGREENLAGLQFNITSTLCLSTGSVYTFKMKYRLHHAQGGGSGVPEVNMIFPDTMGSEDGLIMQKLGDCPDSIWDLAGTWTECSLSVVLTPEMVEAPWITVRTTFWDDSESDIDYDDISFELFNPLQSTTPYGGIRAGDANVADNPNAIVVSDSNAINCWGPGAELLITSDTIQPWHFQVVTVASTDPFTGVITLTEPLEQVPTTSEDDPIYAVEVALLNRNFVVEAASDDSDSDLSGHMIVYRTPLVKQMIKGIEFRRMGRQGVLGRYPIHFHMSENCEGSVVSRNLIRESKQRCVVIHGTHNVTVEYNVAFDTFGHCFVLEDGGEYGNTFQYNLGAHTKSMSESKRIADSATDHNCATFWFTNPMNHFIGNIAAGSERMGIWLEFFFDVQGESRFLPINIKQRPRFLPLGTFKDNVAHSNERFGISTYKPGYTPEKQEVFENMISYKNNWQGLFLHNSENIMVVGGHMADNMDCIRNLKANNVVVDGLECVGLSPNFRDITDTRGKHVWQHCNGNNDRKISGITWTPTQDPETGLIVKNCDFQGFANGARCEGNALSSEREFIGRAVQTNVVSFSNNKFDSQERRISVCRSVIRPKKDIIMTNMAVEDSDGSIRGSVGRGFYVQEDDELLSLIPNDCTGVIGSCMKYCEGACLRLLIVQSTSAFTADGVRMVITESSGRSARFRRHYNEKDDPYGIRSDEVSFFSAWLPSGQFTMSFVDAFGNSVWPDFVNYFFETKPTCHTDMDESSIVLQKPPQDGRCDEIIKNGDLESGNFYGWQQQFAGLEMMQGGSPKSPQWALRTTSRTKKSHYSSVRQYLDASCFQEPFVDYKISGNLRLVDSGRRDVACDPNKKIDQKEACPRISFTTHFWDPVEKDSAESEKITIGKLTSQAGGAWSAFNVVITLPPKMADSDVVSLRLHGSELDYYMDDFSVQPVKYTGVKWVQLNGDGLLSPLSSSDASNQRQNLSALWQLSPNKIVKRACTRCDNSHKTIFYKRLTPVTDFTAFMERFEDGWSEEDNVMHQDFKLYSSYEDALADTNSWQFCSFSDPKRIGFPDECGPSGPVQGQWNCFRKSVGQTHVAFFVEQPL